MNDSRWARTRYWWVWWIRHNPTYLISAALMAVGARMYLVHPSTRAGDVGVIFLTLGVLQAYEWAVATILLILHRSRRCPEDEPSLMLVAALFWTGPLAATAEMTARHSSLGLIAACGACMIALVELQVVRRLLRWRIGVAGQLAVCACVVLLAIAPSLVRVPEAVDGTNELWLYAVWWLLGAIALLGLGPVRRYGWDRDESGTQGQVWRHWEGEIGLLAVTLAASAAHLIAMNYAFFGHARMFYGSPLIVAVAVVGMEFLAITRTRSYIALVVFASLPAVAIVLTQQPFHENVPTALLPLYVRDPLTCVLLLASATWWYGGIRSRLPVICHVGSVALVWAVVRLASIVLPVYTAKAYPVVHIAPSRELLVLALYMLAGYLALSALVRRSRIEAVAALIVQQAALTVMIWEGTVVDAMILCMVGGWSWLVCLHLLVRRPCVALALWPIAFLLLVTWVFDFSEILRWSARLHGLSVAAVLLCTGVLWPWTRYRFMGAGAGVAHAGFLLARTAGTGPHATEALVVTASFILLMAGAVISWRKKALLGSDIASSATADLTAMQDWREPMEEEPSP